MIWRRPRRLAALSAFLVALLVIGTASASAQPADPGAARLAGNFLMHGRLTVATGVRGEHVGERVTRQWTFVPQCPAGPCSQVGLARARTSGLDLLVLRQLARARYVGTGTFYAPLRCAGTTYQRGEAVAFTITVQIIAAVDFLGVIVATRIRASYVSRRRVNLTPCVRPRAHEAAAYRGQVVPA